MKSELLNQKSAAQFLGVDRWTLWKWHACGIGPPRFKIGKRYYYTRDKIRQWQADLTEIARSSSASAAPSPVPAALQTTS